MYSIKQSKICSSCAIQTCLINGDPDFKVSSSVLEIYYTLDYIITIGSNWQNVQYTVVNVFLHISFKVTKSAIMNIFLKKSKSFVKIELSYAFKIHLFTIVENCMEK